MTSSKKYLLKGDISGIQDFIFNVSSKRAAKSLKARSYYVQILGKLANEFVLKTLPYSIEFYEGGGSFFIEFEAESDETAKSSVNEIRKILNETPRKEDLLIHLSFVSIENKNFWIKLREHSNKEKLKSFSDEFQFFKEYHKMKEIDTIQFPQVEDWLAKTSKLDKDSNQFKALTEIMVKQGKILVRLLKGEFDENDAQIEESLVNKLPFWEDYLEKNNYETFRKSNKSIYTDNEELKNKYIVDFDGLGDFASHRTGTNKIGILKLDVDNLGKLFGSADYEKVKQYSKIFSTFFSQTLYNSLYASGSFSLVGDGTEKYRPNIYPIFAGGDDCFIIGGWDAVLCFARDLHKLFCNDETIKSIALDGKPITFSAGIILVNPAHPVRNFSELAEEALFQAKSSGKNRISIFGLTFSWGEYKLILETSKLLADEMIDQNISRAYLDKIRKSAKGFNALQNRDGADFDKIYKLKYYLSKNDNKLGFVVEKLFEPYYESLKSRLLGKSSNEFDVAIYPTITRITEFLTKTKLNYERSKTV